VIGYAIASALFSALPPAVLACPVCFGQSDSLMAQATNLGIIAMLGVVAAVLAGFAAFFVNLNRRARRAADEVERGVEFARASVARPNAQEGTAEC
jgi:hypothetical protein